ncbi:beta-glucosidase BglX [Flavobacterium sp. MAH-1]|uniref:Periplasmic beta-glucosidase n=1 Tax=Flavobacterium agri TaxID=2743471 RepID=A0A7Y8Y442_9FLAO|nr:beta-glucosidase BglX [Flavobacterium agri]NUY82215.1 beta-glucosidase BglX [Flavobacterium agri]NYA72239.1 beta-glucosidase BglX [Flavobacterium agri]
MKRQLIALSLLVAVTAYPQKKKATKTTIKPRAEFVSELMSKMTLDEKIGQLNLPTSGDITTGQSNSWDIAKKIEEGKVGGLFNIKTVAKIRDVQKLAVEKSRLHIPMIFGMDVIHGYETVFPIPLGLSCSWDMAAIEKSAQIAAREATADGINWTFSPMVDICRDARWGRIAEGSGEDAYLGSRIAEAMVRGYQGKDYSTGTTMMSCVKHFALYGAAEAGRDYNTTDMSHIRMYNEYFPPYKAAFDAGAGSAMASFNEIDGIPATGNKWLLTDVLRKQWGFKGFVVTDFTGIPEMIEHGMGDLQTVSALALTAGVEMDMVGEGFLTTLKKSLDEGKVTMAQIDNACRLILEAKYDLGLFEDPYKYCNLDRAKTEIFTKSNRDIARKIAAESMVLLKNDKQTLPLKKSGTIALIGPLADAKENMGGTWSVAGRMNDNISLLAGMKAVAGNSAKILYAKGSNLDYDAKFEENATMFGKTLHRDSRSPEVLLKEALDIAGQADVIVAAIGESAEMSGESSSRTNIEIPQAQKDLLQALVKTGKPVVVVLFNGRPLALVDEEKSATAILDVWFSGSESGYAISDVLFGAVNPSGKLTTSFPRSVGQVPIFYSAKNTGRPLSNKEGKFEKFRSNYIDERNEPLFPFGFGLSYTKFEYSNLKISSNKVGMNDTFTVSVDVTNSGNYDGAEVVQLYIRDLVGSVTRPVRELKGFNKTFLKKGEKKTVTFNLSAEDLKFYNSDLQFVAEPGAFQAFVGTNSNADMKVDFELTK